MFFGEEKEPTPASFEFIEPTPMNIEYFKINLVQEMVFPETRLDHRVLIESETKSLSTTDSSRLYTASDVCLFSL